MWRFRNGYGRWWLGEVLSDWSSAISLGERRASRVSWEKCWYVRVECLNVNPSASPKRQLPRRSSKDHSDAVKDEVMKLKEAGAINEVFYPEWLANIVVVKKKSGNDACVRRLYGLEQNLFKGPFPPTLNRPISRCNGRPSLDEFLRHLPRIPLNTTGLGRSRKDSFYHLY